MIATDNIDKSKVMPVAAELVYDEEKKIFTPESYYANLFKIQETENLPSLAVLRPDRNNLYSVDLDTRHIEAPEYLSVTDNHVSETVYFLVDRFYDNMDLSETGCVVQYINAKGEGRLYSVPYYDIETFHAQQKMIVPWCIEGEATKAAGTVRFALRFFKVDGINKKLLYNLNTEPTSAKVMQGINILDYYKVEDITADMYYDAPDRFYIKNKNGQYERATGAFSANQEYYSITEGYDYAGSELEAIYERLMKLEREFNVYWYDAGIDI